MVFKSSGVIFAIVRDAQKHHKKTIERKETREKDTQNEKKRRDEILNSSTYTELKLTKKSVEKWRLLSYSVHK